MATKPTERILDWASGGTNTDPGAGKEAAGWLVAERPPAYWWNWILNSFGKWLSWAETSIDALDVGASQAFGVVRSGASAAVIYDGLNLSSMGTSGQNIIVNLGATFNSTDEMCISMTCESNLYIFSAFPASTSSIEISAWQPHTSSALNLTTNALDFHINVRGVLA